MGVGAVMSDGRPHCVYLFGVGFVVWQAWRWGIGIDSLDSMSVLINTVH